MAVYTMVARGFLGSTIGGIRFFDLQGEMILNKPAEIRFSMPRSDLNMYTEATFGPLKTEIWLYRDDVLIFNGPIWELRVSTDSKVSVVCRDMSSRLSLRIVRDSWTLSGTTAAIAANIVGSTLNLINGDLDITLYQNVSGTPPTLYYTPKYGQTIMAVLDDLVEAGMEWDMYPYGTLSENALNLYTPSLYRATDTTGLYYGSGILKYNLSYMGNAMANYVVATGKEIQSDPYVNTDSRAIYMNIERVESFSDIENKTVLNTMAGNILSRRLSPRTFPQFVINPETTNPFEGGINKGAEFQVVIDDGYVNINEQFRCNGFQFTVGRQGNESFNIYGSAKPEVVI